MPLQEMRGVIEFDGSYVNYRHLAILCEVRGGALQGASRPSAPQDRWLQLQHRDAEVSPRHWGWR